MRRILFVSQIFPSDFKTAVYGVFQRTRMLLEAAAAVSEALDILFFVEPHQLPLVDPRSFSVSLKDHWGVEARVLLGALGARATTRWNAYVAPVWSITNHDAFFASVGSQQVQALRDAIKPTTDLIVAESLHMALAVARLKGKRPPMVVDLDDIEHMKFLRNLARPPHWPSKRIGYLHLPALLAAEARTLSRSARTFVCSNEDKARLTRLARDARVEVIPNGIAFPKTANRGPGRFLLFVGTYTYAPNVDAAELLIRTVFPIVRKGCPDIRLVIVGNRIERLPSHGGHFPGVEFMGFVPSLSEIYASAAVVCCPIQSGTGTRIKIIEAAAYAVPVVSTTLGAEGLDFEDGTEIVLRDDPQQFAEACVKLLRDRELADAMGLRAREKAKAYDRNTVISLIAEHYLEAASVSRPRGKGEGNRDSGA